MESQSFITEISPLSIHSKTWHSVDFEKEIRIGLQLLQNDDYKTNYACRYRYFAWHSVLLRKGKSSGMRKEGQRFVIVNSPLKSCMVQGKHHLFGIKNSLIDSGIRFVAGSQH